MKVDWSAPAIADLIAIHDFLTHGSPRYADGVVARLTRAVDPLAKFPQLGRRLRMPTRSADPIFRELVVADYRIVYRVEPERVLVLAVVDARRDIDPATLLDRPDAGDPKPN